MGKKASGLTVAAGVFGGLSAFALLTAVVGGLWFVGGKNAERNRKREMYEQRRVYDAWSAADLRVTFAESRLKGETRPEKVEQFREELAGAKKARAEWEEESRRRWGKPPGEFGGHPSRLSDYYKDAVSD